MDTVGKHKGLLKKCKELPFAKGKALSDVMFESTMSELDSLFREYDYAAVLGTLASVWTFEDAVRLFGKYGQCFQSGRSIRTIATMFYRACSGGTERVNAALMSIWVKMGLRVILFTEEPENPLDFSYPKSVKRIVIPPKTEIKARLLSLQTHCREEQVDLFINHEWPKQSFIWECALMKRLHIYCVQYCHRHFASNCKMVDTFFAQLANFKLCDMVIAISETNAKFYQLCLCNTFLMQNPIPRDLATVAIPASLNSNRVLMVGRLAKEKSPLETLEIFKLVHDELPEVMLDVVGDGDMDDDMRKYVQAHGLRNCVVFHGAKTTTELDAYYRNAACVLFASKMEGYPMVLLEAKAYGVPVVMYELPYLTLVKDGKGVLSAPIGDCRKIAEHLIKVMRDKEYRHKLGNDARESFDHFNSHDHIADWDRIFKILSGDIKGHCGSFYSPDALSNDERYVLPMLMNELKVGYDIMNARIDYKIGKAILSIPRMIYHGIRRIMHIARKGGMKID